MASVRNSAERAEIWAAAENVLCVRLDTLGDVLMTTPALRGLKEARPDRRITLLTSAPGAAAAALVPEIDDIIIYDAPWLKATAPRDNSAPEYAMAERLRARNFDAAVIFTVYSQNPLPSAFLCYLADIPLRLAHCHENPYQLLTDWILDPEPGQEIRHEAQRQIDLMAAVGCAPMERGLSLRVPDGATESVLALLAAEGFDPTRPWAVIHPGASAASRRYPPEQYAVVARRLAAEAGVQLVFTGVKAEIGLIDGIRAGIGPAISLAGMLDLGEMAALLKLVPLLISNNTGPVHMAAALGTPVVVLYALTNPQHTPWQTPSRVLFRDVPCKYCYKSICPLEHNNCLRLVPPDAVVDAALELMDMVEGSRLQVEGCASLAKLD
jgi:lipopolysaccharide heptosyltransferase II